MISISASTGDLSVINISDEGNVIVEILGQDRKTRRTTTDAIVQLLDETLTERRRLLAADRARRMAVTDTRFGGE